MANEFEIENGVLVAYKGKAHTVKVPEGITVIGQSAFQENKYIRKVHLPEGVRKIENWSFCRCINLKQVHFPQSLEEIGLRAFLHCARLESPEFPIYDLVDGKKVGGLRQIGSQAFYGCKSIKSVELPIGMVGVGDEAFAMCQSLSHVSIRSDLTFTDGLDTKPADDRFYKIGACKHLFTGASKKLVIFCKSDEIPAHWDPLWNHDARGIYHSVVVGYQEQID